MLYDNDMRILWNLVRISSIYFLCSSVLAVASLTEFAFASNLVAIADTLSNTKAGALHVTHTATFTTATAAVLERIDFKFSKNSDGSGGRPTGLNLSSSTTGSITGFASTSWSFITSNAGTGTLTLQNLSGTSIASNTVITVPLQEITNSDLEDCEPGSGNLQDTCYLTISTFSDNGITIIDSAITSYTVNQDPNLTFEVLGVAAGQTHNGITSSITSTSTSLPFGLLKPGTVVYIGHKLTIKTNAPHGYVVEAYLPSLIAGAYSSSHISPFGALNATWSTPQNWSSPNGTNANTDSGWFGANTTDARVTGWSGITTGKFGPISGSAHAVAYSSSSDRLGSTIYVTYGLEVNSVQPSDTYSGTIIYDVRATY